MARRFTAVIALLTLACTVIASAPSARAADPDPATPKGAAEGFFRALEAGDTGKAKAYAVGEAKQMEMLDMLVPLVGNFKKMEVAAVKKWGAEGKKMLSDGAGGPGGFDVEAQLKDAKVEEKGDTATITPAKKEEGKNEPMKLRKVQGKWKVDMAAMPNAEGMDTPQAKKMLSGMGDIAKQMATEIEAGKYQTPEQAKEAFGQKMLPLFLGAAAEGGAGAQPAGAGQPPKKEDK
jgi:hypothetical protein